MSLAQVLHAVLVLLLAGVVLRRWRRDRLGWSGLQVAGSRAAQAGAYVARCWGGGLVWALAIGVAALAHAPAWVLTGLGAVGVALLITGAVSSFLHGYFENRESKL